MVIDGQLFYCAEVGCIMLVIMQVLLLVNPDIQILLPVACSSCCAQLWQKNIVIDFLPVNC